MLHVKGTMYENKYFSLGIYMCIYAYYPMESTVLKSSAENNPVGEDWL